MNQPIFTALADPTRRQMLDRLVSEGPATATRLAGELPITRQAVAKHLTVLQEAGLVVRESVGRETIFQASPEALDEVKAWIDQVGAQWDRRLRRLRQSLE
ncbi:MAG: metalloregulator ArsR/SmtB family transcription factor [Actinobacteria bacterium]|nr:metalloregulator ArsR/SmtB family transcription factor [Actinomycetota bacterium]